MAMHIAYNIQQRLMQLTHVRTYIYACNTHIPRGSRLKPPYYSNAHVDLPLVVKVRALFLPKLT